MKTSEPIVVKNTYEGEEAPAVTVVFIHTDNFTVIAEITMSHMYGRVRAIRKSETDWVILDDNRQVIDKYFCMSSGPLDIEKVYSKYMTDMFST